MTSSERIDSLFSGRLPDRVPLGAMGAGFSTRNYGIKVSNIYDEPEKAFKAMCWTAEQYCWDPVPHYSAHTVLGAWDFGGQVRLPKGEYEGALVVESYPIRSENEIERLKMPDARNSGRIPEAMAFSRLQKDHDIPVYFFSRSPFAMAANLCGLDLFLRWILKKPTLCKILMNMALDHIFQVLDYWIEVFGTEDIFAWISSPGESNQLISPKIFEKFALPLHVEYHERLKAKGINRFGIHICGHQNLNLPIFAQAVPWPHPSVLSFGHEVDLESAARYFPEDIIYGNIEPSVIQTGSPEKVYELSRQAIFKGRKAQGGFILGPGCGLPPMAPSVNVYAMTKAVNDFGWY